MMSDDKDLDDSFDSTSASSNLLGTGLKKKTTTDIPFCGCLSIQYYQPYFDVDTADITSRIWNAVIYCRREQNFLLLVQDHPDLYGPFWIATTLVFSLAVSSNLSGWLHSFMNESEWAYDFQSVITSSSLIYGFALGAPSAVWFVFKQYEPNLLLMSTICLYGYSLTIYVPAVIICMFPSNLACWLSILAASVVSSLFLLRSLAPIVINHAKNQATVLLAILGCIQLVLGLCIKLYIFYDK